MRLRASAAASSSRPSMNMPYARTATAAVAAYRSIVSRLGRFCRDLDRRVLAMGGRLYTAKDSRTDAATFAAATLASAVATSNSA